MAADFKVVGAEKLRTVFAKKGSSTVIEAGDLVALSSGLIVKAGAASAAIAFAPNGAADGETVCEVTVGNDFLLMGMKDSDAVFAQSQCGALCDVAGTTNLIIDNDTQATNVLRLSIDDTHGTVGSKVGLVAKIALPLF
jgi:hypothetical protein